MLHRPIASCHPAAPGEGGFPAMSRSTPRRAFALLLAVPAAACAAPPPAAPRLTPGSDVAVTYRLSGAQHGTLRRAWLADAARARVAFGPEGEAGGYTIIDGPAGRAFMISEVTRTVTILSLPPGTGLQDPVLRPDAPYTWAGRDRVAGVPCDIWRIAPPGEAPSRACLTADGVLLRGETEIEGHRLAREAVALRYGPQDPARFQPPAGYAWLDLTEAAAPGGRP